MRERKMKDAGIVANVVYVMRMAMVRCICNHLFPAGPRQYDQWRVIEEINQLKLRTLCNTACLTFQLPYVTTGSFHHLTVTCNNIQALYCVGILLYCVVLNITFCVSFTVLIYV